jgi:3-deoxy-D-manno-octulosonic-acid transferase
LGVLIDCLYLTALSLASPFLIYKTITRPRHVRGLRRRLGFNLPKAGESPCIWVHGVSVGEILAAKPFVKALEEAFPGTEIVISTTTSTGQEVAVKNYPNHKVFYFPIDFSFSVSRVVNAINPKLIVLVELELWPNFLQYAERKNIPVAVINGRISERSSRRYNLAPAIVSKMLQNVALYCVQTDTYADRFRSLGVREERLSVTDSMKYDSVRSPKDVDAPAIRKRLGITPSAPVLIGGSTHPSEEQIIIESFLELRKAHSDLRLILVPRHNERSSELEKDIQNMGEACLRFSQIEEQAPKMEQAPVILVDVMGELGRLYAAADLCFVGGSLIPHGGQNILEPANLGKAVLFGPHCFNFQESVDDLLAHNAALQVEDAKALTSALGNLLENPDRCQALGAQARATLERKRGATRKTIEKLSTLLQ